MQKTVWRTNFFHMFILQVISATGADLTGVQENPPKEAPQVSTVVKVATDKPSVAVNIFMGTLQGIIGFTITQVHILVDDRYVSHDSVIY